MRLLVVADLHFDDWSARGLDPFAGSEELLGDMDQVVLAGDLSNKAKVRWKYVLQSLGRFVAPERIAVFPGNHDFYDFRIDGEDRLRDAAAAGGATYAQMRELRFEGLRCLCATLWTDLALHQGFGANRARIASKMNDYRYIRVAHAGFRRLTPEDVVEIHGRHLAWLDQALAAPFRGETWVITHHAPHPAALTDHAEGVEAAYASDLSRLILRRQPARWLYGHCHFGHSLKIGETRLDNVSLGGPNEPPEGPAARLRSLAFQAPPRS